LLPSVAAAQANPRMMLEKSQSYALDNNVRAFQVPVTDSAGVVKFYDITVTLGVSATGVPISTASVTATRSPAVSTGVIVPGTYLATDGTRCVVTNITLTNGRIQSFFSCLDNGVSTLPHQLSVATGPVSAGHPFLDALLAAGINLRPDVNTYTWGLTTNGTFSVGTCGNFGPGWPIGAKTNGNQLILSVFNYFKPGAFRCSATFMKQP
jgi:hypothetical protein